MTAGAHPGPAPDATSPGAMTSGTPRAAAAPSWRWRRWAILLSVAGQLITISALVGTDSPPHTWPSFLLASAPAPLAGLAALTPRRYALAATVIAAVVLVAGMAGTLVHTGLFFLPALVALAGGGVLLWRER
jgi:hypothetical protein